MNKFIDSEKLIAEIERLKEKVSEDFIFSRDEEGAKRERLIESEIHARIKCVLCDTFIELVTTLQQEQPEYIEKTARISPGLLSNFGTSAYVLDVNLTQDEIAKVAPFGFNSGEIKIKIACE